MNKLRGAQLQPLSVSLAAWLHCYHGDQQPCRSPWVPLRASALVTTATGLSIQLLWVYSLSRICASVFQLALSVCVQDLVYVGASF